MIKKLIGCLRAATSSQRANPLISTEPSSLPTNMDRRVFHDDELNQWMNDATGELFPGFVISDADTVVDIGCGDGGFANFCALQGASVVLADIDVDRLNSAHKMICNNTSRLMALVTDSNPLPLADAIATRIIAMEVLEHVDSPTRFLEELVRVGAPNALYYISVPDAEIETLQKPIAPAIYYHKPNHIHIFDRNSLVNLVQNAGLVVEHEMTYGFYWSIWWMFFWACKQDLSPPWHPVLDGWRNVWTQLLELEKGPQIKSILDNHLPKSRGIIARKPTAQELRP